VLELHPGPGLTLAEALIATAKPQLWEHYCRLAAGLAGITAAIEPAFAVGSVEWQQQDQPRLPAKSRFSEMAEAAGRRRLVRRGAAPAFSGVPSPLGAAGAAAFDEFIARHRGPPALLAEIEAVEQQLVDAFENAGRSGHYRAIGYCHAARIEVDPSGFGQMRLDFANNRMILPDGSEIAGVGVTLAVAGRGGRERPARAMLREALIALWERGGFTAGTGNERVLALVLLELGLSTADPPYGFKSAETVRKLRKALKMSL
jgi:hypothetical protein